MENPLNNWIPREFSSSELGRESREVKRKQDEDNSIKLGLKIFLQYLPWMFESKPDTHRFEDRWPAIDKKLRETFNNKSQYKFVHNQIITLLRKGCESGFWDIKLPSSYAEIKSRKTIRSIEWQKNSQSMTKISWQTIFTRSPNTLTTSEAFAQILLSAIIHGGLNRKELWPEFANQLLKAKPFEGNNEFLYFQFRFPPTKIIPSNYRYWDDGKKAYVEEVNFIYMPDPISLGLIYQFITRAKESWILPTTPEACIKLINHSFNLKFTTNKLSITGITFAEQLPKITLPHIFTEIALGNQISSSLPQAYWNRIFNPITKDVQSDNFRNFAYSKSNKNTKTQIPSFSDDIPEFYQKLRNIFSWPSNVDKKPKTIIQELTILTQSQLSLPQFALLEWLINLLKVRKNAASTAKRYFHTMALKWLVSSQNCELLEMNADDFDRLYNEIINEIPKPEERDFCFGRLHDFHNFCVAEKGFPALSKGQFPNNESLDHVCSGFIDESLFKALLLQFNMLTDINAFLRKMYRCFLVMAYRTGLRPKELAKLRIKDIEPSKQMYLFILDNKYGKNKTEFSDRKIPLMTLLTQEERNIVEEYRNERELKNCSLTSLFFIMPENEFQRISTSILASAVGKILFTLSGGIYYRLYHLRHSALSRLQLIIHSDQLAYPKHIDDLIPYDKTQRQEIIHAICGKDRIRDRYHALAYFAGHHSPKVTFYHYLHFSDIILGLYLQQNSMVLTDNQLSAIYNLSHHKIKKEFPFSADKSPKNVVNILRNKLLKFNQKIPTVIDPDESLNISNYQYSKPFTSICDNFHIAAKLLNIVQDGGDYSDFAHRKNLTSEMINQWINSAIALKALKTPKGHSLLFTQSRRDKLLPAMLQDHFEKQDLTQALDRYQLYFSAQHNDHELLMTIKYALTHCNVNRSGIFFDNAAHFQTFMKIACLFFPSTRWRLLLNCANSKKISHWKYQKVQIQPYEKKQKQYFSHGKGWLVVIHKNEENKINDNQSSYSSHSFIFLFHQLAIMLFREEEIREWQKTKEEYNQRHLFEIYQ